MLQFFMVVFLIFGRSSGVIYSLNASEYNKMPALFDLDDYNACMLDPGGTYCVLDVALQTGSNPNLMRMIQGYSDHTVKHFNHTQIHRGVCVTNTCKNFITVPSLNDTEGLTHTLEACLNSSLFSQYGLEGRVADVQYCDKEGDNITIDNTDIAMAVVYLVLFVLNVVGTFYDILKCKKEDKTGNPYLLAFSVRRNWAKLSASSDNPKEPRIERLKLFYSLRTMTMFCVFFSHTALIIVHSYVENPLYIETSYEDPLKQILFSGSLVTQTFFIMSAFLLAYNFQLYSEKHKVSWILLPKGILLRWLRLTPTYALVMFSISTWMRHAYRGALWSAVVTSEALVCRHYWWTHLLYINNYVYDNALCMPQTCEYNKMPALFDLDDYNACMLDPGGTYCVLDVALQTGSNPNLMRMIQGYSDHTVKHFNHTQIHRGVCVTNTCKNFITVPSLNDTEGLTHTLEACLNSSLFSQYGLEGRVADVQYCDKEGDNITIDNTDIAMAVVYLVLFVLNVVGTFYDILKCKKEDKTGNPYLLAFSVRRNWAKLSASSDNPKEPRIERLKLFYSLRTMTMFCVFFSHTALIIVHSYVENPLYIETSYEDPLKQILFSGSLVTQTFFIMSAFLLAYNFQLYSEKHKVSWILLPKGILLRWLRLTPTYALVMFSISTWMRHAYRGALWSAVVTSEALVCRHYWWTHLLYINNYVYDNALCMPQTWYLAADTQLFCVGLVVCVAARSRRARTVTLVLLLVTALAIVAGHTYFQDLDAVVIQSPEAFRNVYATDNTFRLLYIRGHTNLSALVVGMAGGFLTYHWQNGKESDKYKRYRWGVWLLFPAGLGAMLLGGLFYSDGSRAPVLLQVLYATFHKTFFQILVVALVLGCVFKCESVYRGLLEWRGWTWMGRVSYCAFLLHTMFQRGHVGAQTQPIYMTDYYVMILLAATIFLSYMCAALLWVCVEAPAAALIRAALAHPNNNNDKEEGHTTKV